VADFIASVPGFWALLALSAVVMGAELAILGQSRAQLARQETARLLAPSGDWQACAALRPPSRLFELLAAMLPGIVLFSFVRVIQDARHLLATAKTPAVAVDDKAAMAAQAFSAELNTIPMASWAIGIVVVLGSLAASTAISARQRGRGLREAGRLGPGAPEAAKAWLEFPGPEMMPILGGIGSFLILGFLPLVRAGFYGVTDKIHAFAAVARLPVEEKGLSLDHALDEMARALDRSMVFARLGLVAATVIAAVLAWRFSAARARHRLLTPPGPRGTGGVVIALVVIASALVAFVAAEPLRAENELPWPAYEGGERLMALIATPDLEGPDEMERLPVVYLTPDAMGLDGREMAPADIAMQLDTTRQRFPSLKGQALIVCQADTGTDRLTEALRAAVSAGIPHATFVFLRRQVVDRPLLGHHWRNRARAARTTVVENRADVSSSTTTLLEVTRFSTCASLSRDIVAARNAKRDVALLLPPLF